MQKRSLLLALAVPLLASAAEGFDPDAWRQAIRAHRGELEACFKTSVAPKGEDPFIYLAWQIDSTGRSRDAEVKGTNLEAGQDCFLKRIGELEVPKPPSASLEASWRLDFENGKLVDDDPEIVPGADPEADRKQAEQRMRDEEQYERDHPPGLAEMWEMGGAGMYPIMLGLMLGLAAGLLALALAFGRSGRAAVIVAGIAIGSGAFAISAGCLGYVNGMMGAYSAVANVNPLDKEAIMHAADREASMCWKFGLIAFLPSALLGAMAITGALRRKEVAHV